ncbi:MAG: hypothetical protein IJJ00_07565 [Erysipelotrichaceae bacterium]|nr:hypothetical protein [Erysipelotrichaceae bacterium]
MYKDKKKRNFLIPLLIVLLLIGGVFLYRKLNDTGKMNEELAESLKETIMKSALRCYVVEGSYPESLEYLEENYGLIINHKDYRVTYEIFADNLAPEVRVAYKHK